MSCFRAIPFNDTIRDLTTVSLSKAVQLYAFLDIAADPPVFSPPVDLLNEFVRIRY